MAVDYKSPVTSQNVNESFLSRKQNTSAIGLIDLLNQGGIANPARLDAKKDTEANLVTYASTASDGQICFATDTKKFYAIYDNILNEVGGGGGGLSQWETEGGYVIGDVIWLLADDVIYRCIADNNDVSFIPSKWQALSSSATTTSYDNSTSGLTATTVQGAVDEVQANVEDNTTLIESNDTDISNLEAKTNSVRYFENYNEDLPSVIYSGSLGLTNSIVDDASADRVDKNFSSCPSLTLDASDAGEYFLGLTKTGLSKVDKELLGVSLDWESLAGTAQIQLAIEESSDGVSFTVYNAPMSLGSGATKSYQLNFKLQDDTTHYRERYNIVAAAGGEVLRWANVKVFTDPLNVVSSDQIETFEVNTYSGYGSTNNKIMRFSNVVEDSTSELISVVNNDPVLGANVTALTDCIVNFSFTHNASAASHIGLSKNSSSLTTAVNSLTANERISVTTVSSSGWSDVAATEVRLKAGDVVRPHTDGTGSADATRSIFNVTAKRSSSNVVFKGQTSALDSKVFTANFDGWTTTQQEFVWSQVGDKMRVQGIAQFATASAVQARLYLPNGATVGGSTALLRHVGTLTRGGSVGGNNGGVVQAMSGNNYVTFSASSVWSTANVNSLTQANASAIASAGQVVSFDFEVPVNELKASDIIYSVPVTNEVENVYSAKIANNGTASISSVSSGFIDRVNRTSAGTVEINFRAGFFSQEPAIISMNANQGTNPDTVMSRVSGSSTQVVLYAADISAGSNGVDVDFDFAVQRQGADYKAPQGGFLGNMPSTAHVTGGVEYPTADTCGGKRIFARSWEVASNLSGAGSITPAPPSGLKPVGHLQYATNAWLIMERTAAGGSTNIVNINYNSGTGSINYSATGNSIVAGTIFTLRYIK